MTVVSHIGVGPGGTVTLRSRDHQLINYAYPWGVSIPQAPYFTNVHQASWDQIIQAETVWLKDKGWL